MTERRPAGAGSRSRRSAGLLMYRVRDGRIEFFLAHPGGPYFAKKDEGVWTIPKGEIERADDPLATAIREFQEETGIPPRGPYVELGEITQKGGKIVRAWAFEAPADLDEARPVASNTFDLEWPPKSGQMQSFPEVDRAGFFDLETARRKIKDTQIPLLERLAGALTIDD